MKRFGGKKNSWPGLGRKMPEEIARFCAKELLVPLFEGFSNEYLVKERNRGIFFLKFQPQIMGIDEVILQAMLDFSKFGQLASNRSG